MNDLPPLFKIVTVWLLVGTLLFLGIRAMQVQRGGTEVRLENGVVELQRAADGHYHWPGSIGGKDVVFMVDTGATVTSIPADLARAAKLARVGTSSFDTANGRTVNAIVVGDLELEGGVRVNALRMGVLPGGSGQALLGMDVIGRLGMSVSGNVMQFRLQRE